MTRTHRRRARLLALLLAPALVATACGNEEAENPAGDILAENQPDGEVSVDEPTTVTLITHDSFNISESVFEEFEAESGVTVEVLPAGDAGTALNQAILTKGDPQGDVFFGIDNTFLSRAFEEDLFVPYESPALDRVPDELIIDSDHRVTPIDTGHVCLNYDISALAEAGVEPPGSLQDLTDPAYAGMLVVENPATSSPGLAFLLATVDEFGQAGWQEYWRGLVANDVEVVAGWEEAYYGSFSGSAGSTGDRPIVVSYATSPVAEVVFAEEPLDAPPTGVVLDSCYQQVEFAGILEGTDDPDAARLLIDFMLSDTFQADIPLNMFVYPVTDVELPEPFVEFAERPEDPYRLLYETVADNRDEWIEEWTEIVLR
jgi:thiamine transport system substrate-binding protein